MITLNEKPMINKLTKTRKHNGIPISRRVHTARLLFFIIATPLLTWYAHQYYTNPYNYHTIWKLEQEKGVPYLHVYEHSINGNRDNIYIPLDGSSDFKPVINGSILSYEENSNAIIHTLASKKKNACDSLLSLKFNATTVSVQNRSINIITADTSIIILNTNSKMQSHISSDIAISRTRSLEDLLKQRELYSPKLTIWLNKDANNNTLPSNIYTWNGKKRKYIVKKGRKFIVIDPDYSK